MVDHNNLKVIIHGVQAATYTWHALMTHFNFLLVLSFWTWHVWITVVWLAFLSFAGVFFACSYTLLHRLWVFFFMVGVGVIIGLARTWEIRMREAGSYLMLEKLKAEALPLHHSFGSWLLGSSDWRKPTAALLEEGHTLILLRGAEGTDKEL